MRTSVGSADTPTDRLAWLGMALATICAGLGIHEIGFGLAGTARDVTGDALWAVMMFAWVGALWPRRSLTARAGIALLMCWIVEFSQAYHAPWLDAVRRTTVGQLVLGSGFDVRDLASYALGILIACALEASVRRRAPNRTL